MPRHEFALSSFAPQRAAATNRRRFLRCAGGGFGAIAASALLAADGVWPAAKAQAASAASLAPAKPPSAARAKRVIYLFMHGGPSQVDLFEPKPDLIRLAGEPLPESFGD